MFRVNNGNTQNGNITGVVVVSVLLISKEATEDFFLKEAVPKS